MRQAGARKMLVLAAIVAVVALVSGVWELWARQAPGSLLYLGMLPGPIGSLRLTATILALAIVVAALLANATDAADRLGGKLLALQSGTAMSVGAGVYGALTGMPGVQLTDPRADAMPLIIIKLLGLGLVSLSLLAVLLGALGGDQNGKGGSA